MKKYSRCSKCKCSYDYKLVCDTCETEKADWDDTVITVIISDTEYHFCSYKCLLKFILNELKKQEPKDYEFGTTEGELDEESI